MVFTLNMSRSTSLIKTFLYRVVSVKLDRVNLTESSVRYFCFRDEDIIKRHHTKDEDYTLHKLTYFESLPFLHCKTFEPTVKR